MSRAREFYMPVCVVMDDEGRIVSARVDGDGAPWAYSDQTTAFDPETEKWVAGCGEGASEDDARGYDKAADWLDRALKGGAS